MRRLLGAFVVGVTLGIIVIYAFLERAPVPVLVWHGHRIDDLALHGLAFAVLAIAVSIWRRVTRKTIFGLAGAAGAVEAIQLTVPERTASALDFAASVVGIGFGTVLAASFVGLPGEDET